MSDIDLSRVSTRPRETLAEDGTELVPERVHKAKARTCLMCSENFESAWAGERICGKCKALAVWRNGNSSITI